MAYKGRFIPTNPQKYRGNVENIIYRSRWEQVVMSRLDTNPSVLEWSSEELAIPYTDRTTGKLRRYFPDFWVKWKTKDGQVETVLIEVKPKTETRPPKKGTKTNKRYVQEVLTWGKNVSKWQAAQSFCKRQGWRWWVMTEDDIGLTF